MQLYDWHPIHFIDMRNDVCPMVRYVYMQIPLHIERKTFALGFLMTHLSLPIALCLVSFFVPALRPLILVCALVVMIVQVWLGHKCLFTLFEKELDPDLHHTLHSPAAKLVKVRPKYMHYFLLSAFPLACILFMAIMMCICQGRAGWDNLDNGWARIVGFWNDK